MHGHDEDGSIEPHRRSSVGNLFPAFPASRGAPEADDSYDADDPKHPDFHSRKSDLWDMREGK